MQTELSKIVQNSEESQVLGTKKRVPKKGLYKFRLGQNIVEPPPPH